MRGKEAKRNMPIPPRFASLIGPSIILLGLGLGSGEIILWPYLVSNFGLGIIWAAVVGITFQFFINMEIERYSIVKGESIFVGFARYSRFSPYWFIFSTFIAWFWPGIIAASAKILARLFGLARFDLLSIGLLILIGFILTLGPTLYKTVERYQKVMIGFGVPLIAFITFYIAGKADWQALGKGIFGLGEGYSFLPKNIPLLTFLGALAYSGAGGNLNLSQSFYIKEKGYGMCKGTRGITSVLTGKARKINLTGETFEKNELNLKRFGSWWKLINLEHLLVFLLTGALAILLLALLSYSTTQGLAGNLKGIDFLFAEAKAVGAIAFPYLGILFLLVTGLMLFGTQLTVLDSTSRIIAENIVIAENKVNLSKIYYTVLWLQIMAASAVFLAGFSEPVTLITIGAVINAFAMFVHIAATYLLNKKSLPKVLQISSWRKAVIGLAWSMFGVLTVWALVDGIAKL